MVELGGNESESSESHSRSPSSSTSSLTSSSLTPFYLSYDLCRSSLESAQKTAYLKAINLVKKCPRPKIASPVGEWECSRISGQGCHKSLFRCKRQYHCEYLNPIVTEALIKREIQAGETGNFFQKYAEQIQHYKKESNGTKQSSKKTRSMNKEQSIQTGVVEFQETQPSEGNNDPSLPDSYQEAKESLDAAEEQLQVQP